MRTGTLVAALLCQLAMVAGMAAQQRITVITIQGSINPASASYIRDALSTARSDSNAAFVLELDTPGGLLESTRDIVSAFLGSTIPVIVYVTPRGSQAASAGAFITMAANIAAMAPGTNIGAAHPIFSGQETAADTAGIMMTKATNDAAAFARTIAEKRKRNIGWAELAVRSSSSLTETEALRNHVIDLIAPSLDSLLSALDGRSIITSSDTVTLRTAGAVFERRDMSFSQKLLNVLSDPNIAYILMMLGMYGLFFELYNPGSIFPGVVGAICIILAFYALNTLTVNVAGIALIVVAIILFLLEIKVVSHGILSIGGVIALFLGSIMLFDTAPGIAMGSLSLPIVLTVTACTAAFFLFVVGKGVAIQKKKPSTGLEGLIGESGTVTDALAPAGRISVHGELWRATCESGSLAPGTVVRVTGIRNLELIVEERLESTARKTPEQNPAN